jgi:two-component system sensor histidine kinase YesM
MQSLKQRVSDMKLRNKLLVSYFVASVIPILVISFTIYRLSAESIEQASEEFASMYISQATTNLDSLMKQFDQSTQSVLLDREMMRILSVRQEATMEELIANRAVIQRFLVRMTGVHPEIKTAMIVDAAGAVYHYTKDPDRVNVATLQQQYWYKHIREAYSSLFLTSIHDRSYYGRDKEGAAITVGRVLWNPDGSYAGTMLLDMDPGELIQLSNDFLKLGNRYDIRLVITNQEGEVVYHSYAATGRLLWGELIGKPYRTEEGRLEDTIVLTSSAVEGELLLRTEIPIQKLLATINSIKHVTMWSIFLCLLFIVTISLFYSYRITRPVQELRRSMKQVELGQYSTLIQVPSANDEISGLVLSYNKMILKIKELIEDVFTAGLKQNQAKLLALQAQINPHMLYNTLESIRMKAVVKEQDEIADMIKILARMFKLSLGVERESNLVRHEVEYAAAYLSLQNLRYDNRFALHIRISDELLETPIIPLVFQPIVENSIKHGFQNYQQRLNIVIEGKHVGRGEFLIRISDNGQSLTKEKAEEINRKLRQSHEETEESSETFERESGSGIGLRNISERLRLQYGDRYGLSIRTRRGVGAVVELLIPIGENHV